MYSVDLKGTFDHVGREGIGGGAHPPFSQGLPFTSLNQYISRDRNFRLKLGRL